MATTAAPTTARVTAADTATGTALVTTLDLGRSCSLLGVTFILHLHTNPFSSTNFYIIMYNLNSLSRESVEVVLHVWVFRGSNHQRKSKGIPIPNLGILYLLLRVTLILHPHTRSHQSLQIHFTLSFGIMTQLFRSVLKLSFKWVFRGAIHLSEWKRHPICNLDFRHSW